MKRILFVVLAIAVLTIPNLTFAQSTAERWGDRAERAWERYNDHLDHNAEVAAEDRRDQRQNKTTIYVNDEQNQTIREQGQLQQSVEMAQVNSVNYQVCVNAGRPNCEDLLQGPSSNSTRSNGFSADRRQPMKLVLINESGYHFCVQAPGQTKNENGARVSDCPGITIQPRRLVSQNWVTAGALEANLSRSKELKLLGTDLGACTNDISVLLRTVNEYTDNNGNVYKPAMIGVITQDDAGNCGANRKYTVDSQGMIHKKK